MPHLVQLDDIGMVDHFEHLDFAMDLRQIFLIQPRFVDNLYCNLENDGNANWVNVPRGRKKRASDFAGEEISLCKLTNGGCVSCDLSETVILTGKSSKEQTFSVVIISFPALRNATCKTKESNNDGHNEHDKTCAQSEHVHT
jgi:hypothetical protein